MEIIDRSTAFIANNLQPRRVHWPVVAVTAASFTLGLIVQNILSAKQKPTLLISPRTTLSSLSDAEQEALPYPLDVLPGARDVSSPYGSIRVYEWGPEDGRKVLLIHGVSTPCIALGAIAHGLVEKGCRVMLFDLFGRGYSDSPDDLRQDARLFTSQIMVVLSSSALSWTGSGSGRFSIIGYSLGGAIAASFTSYFPTLVSSLVLLAPAGLIRSTRISPTSRVLYSRGLIPETVLDYFIRRRLRMYGPSGVRGTRPQVPKTAVSGPINEELPKSGNSFEAATLSKSHPDVTVAKAVAWQVQHHQGFVKAFMSSIRFAPVIEQKEDWGRIGTRLTVQNTNEASEKQEEGLQHGKVLIIVGKSDDAIVCDQLAEDATTVLEGNVEFQYTDAGHDFPITKSEEVKEYIWNFWNTKLD